MAKKNATRGTAPNGANGRKTEQYADQSVTTGAGGEVHQTAGGDTPVLTTQQGIPVGDEQNSLKIGERGPTALEDFHLREKLFHFDH
jgi:catalase